MVETTDVKKFQNRPIGTIRTLALLEAKKGRGKELMDILLELVEPSRNEEGNIAYVPHFNIDNPDKILFDEIWMSKVDLDSHFKLPHMVGLLEKISYLLAKPLVLESYEEVRDEA
jgi:quinol monooxygenase YgiN